MIEPHHIFNQYRCAFLYRRTADCLFGSGVSLHKVEQICFVELERLPGYLEYSHRPAYLIAQIASTGVIFIAAFEDIVSKIMFLQLEP